MTSDSPFRSFTLYLHEQDHADLIAHLVNQPTVEDYLRRLVAEQVLAQPSQSSDSAVLQADQSDIDSLHAEYVILSWLHSQLQTILGSDLQDFIADDDDYEYQSFDDLNQAVSLIQAEMGTRAKSAQDRLDAALAAKANR